MRRFAALLWLCLVIPTSAAAGDLRYQPAAGCPSTADVQKRFDDRAPNAGAIDLAIRSGGAAGGFVGDAVVGTDADAVHRQIEGRTCEAVVDATVVVASLARSSPGTLKTESAPAVTASANAGEREAKPTAPPERARSPVEVAVGASATARQFSLTTASGGGLFVEIGAPALWASWYRPSARLGFQYLDYARSIATPRPSGYLGGTLDLCPLGVAPLSTSYVDVSLAACGTANVGELGGLWADMGALGRTQVQIGRKAAYRAFVDLSVGYLGLLTEGAPSATEQVGVLVASPGGLSMAAAPFSYPERRGMWTAALAGGVLFP
jgi:hypothetical protein